jgi:hypothetical protein
MYNLKIFKVVDLSMVSQQELQSNYHYERIANRQMMMIPALTLQKLQSTLLPSLFRLHFFSVRARRNHRSAGGLAKKLLS